MKTYSYFVEDGDRYRYDFNICSVAKNFAQVDTREDAWYFGIWANPFTRKVVTYAEGDVTVQTAETDEQFVRALEKLEHYYQEGFKGIDPGFSDELRAKFIDIGLEGLIH